MLKRFISILFIFFFTVICVGCSDKRETAKNLSKDYFAKIMKGQFKEAAQVLRCRACLKCLWPSAHPRMLVAARSRVIECTKVVIITNMWCLQKRLATSIMTSFVNSGECLGGDTALSLRDEYAIAVGLKGEI
jgi:hypothetical protein